MEEVPAPVVRVKDDNHPKEESLSDASQKAVVLDSPSLSDMTDQTRTEGIFF